MTNNCQVVADKKASNSGRLFCKLLATVKENLSDLIRRRLAELNLTKAELAKRVGVSRTYVTDLANGTGNTQSGQYRPSPEIVEKLAKHLEIQMSEILNALGYAPENIQPYPKELVMDYDGFDDDDLKEIAEFIKFRKQRKEAKKTNAD